eukprot:scaffold250190_cov27-Tisochrysis_lutea.AAC.2
MSVLELWGAEYQENSAVLLRAEHLKLFEEICEREKCPAAFLGQVRDTAALPWRLQSRVHIGGSATDALARRPGLSRIGTLTTWRNSPPRLLLSFEGDRRRHAHPRRLQGRHYALCSAALACAW